MRTILSFSAKAALIFFSLSIFSVIFFRFVNPPLTPLMVIRYFEHDEGKNGKRVFYKEWKNIDEISNHMVQAAIAAEDNNFMVHYGIDWEAIDKAIKRNKKSRRTLGASTISQQTAKNIFLYPARTFVRKGFEVYFTFLAETFWSKKRIMEVYLNIIELGRGIYGIEAASQLYFKKSASKLSRSEAALLTSAFPNPRKRNPAKPSAYMLRYQNRVLSLMGKIPEVKL